MPAIQIPNLAGRVSPIRLGFMILPCHDSVGPSIREGGELQVIPVDVDPLNRSQSRVAQSFQMSPHRATAPGFGSDGGFPTIPNCWPGVNCSMNETGGNLV